VRERLEDVLARRAELEDLLADPEVQADQPRYVVLAREHSASDELAVAARELITVAGDLEAAGELVADAADAGVTAEIAALEVRHAELERRVRRLLIPRDPDDDRDVILEVRPAAGGDEAGLFAGELLDMYLAYAARQGWTVRELARAAQAVGGIKEAIVEVSGAGAFAALKHESGVHRVQRVPATESQGRIHTSTASVAVLPVAEEVDVDIDASDLRIDVFRSSGPGGQSVNTTDSAVRITHLPSGVVVSCQDEKSQHQNRDKAMRILRSRLLEAARSRAADARADARRVQIGTGDRSEKIRTYNIPQSRVTDHRIGLSLHDPARLLSGDLAPLLDALRDAELEVRLALAGTDPTSGSSGGPTATAR
jgi:peptide chain release factor 1